jgi:hypothetical protein
MSQLAIESYIIPAAVLGGENLLTPLHAYETASATGAKASEADYPDKGWEASILPHHLQDQYGRCRQPRAFKTAVLENEHLRATFLLELGGRLWSLIHKPSGRELLYINSVFQPANLAVRDAWFSGGVEWNISIIGHNPFTCASLFAARVIDDDGTPMLRLYEWDRIRCVPFQIDCWLRDDLPFLLVRVRITNPHDYTIPMYWWSNIAVPERPGVRVLSPADQAFRHHYNGRLDEHDVPVYEGVDVTYPTNRRSAADLYFRIPEGHRPWITALDAEGGGLVHTSTNRLRGRKMFNWGMDAGGRHWQEFLAQRGEAYFEIQGGLAQTQGEYVPMPPGAEWCWLEAYGLMQANPKKVHGGDWQGACAEVEHELERRLPRQWMDAELARSAGVANRPPAELLHQGAGWGALERIRRERAGQAPFASAAVPFPDSSIGPDQMPWLVLLETGRLPYRPPAMAPGSLMVQPEWRHILERTVDDDRSSHWLAWYHLAVMRYRAADGPGARQAWEQSLRCEPSAWAYRDLAVLARDEGNEQAAIELLLSATRLAPAVVPLAIECAQALLRPNRPAELLAFTDALPREIRLHGRIRLLRARAELALGDLDAVGQYLQGEPDIANIRESETVLCDLWFGWQEQRLARQRGLASVDEATRRFVRGEFPPPTRFDFSFKAVED